MLTVSCPFFSGDSGKVTTVVATPGQGPDRPQEVSYTDIKVSVTKTRFLTCSFSAAPHTILVDQDQRSGTVVVLPGAVLIA